MYKYKTIVRILIAIFVEKTIFFVKTQQSKQSEKLSHTVNGFWGYPKKQSLVSKKSIMSSRLSKLYKAMENLKDLGLSINEELIQEVNKMEEEIIKKDILPVLSKTIEPALQPVKRELVLVVDYVPGHPLSVHLSRKRNIAAELTDAKEMVFDPEVMHSTRGSMSGKRKSGRTSSMSVTFRDGTEIAESKAVDTLVAVVRKIGVERVRKVVEDHNLKFVKVPVISNRRDAKYGRSQKELGGGWLLITHCDNRDKKAFIEKVSNVLDLGIKVSLKYSVEDKEQ